jgi:hypothetical protein
MQDMIFSDLISFSIIDYKSKDESVLTLAKFNIELQLLLSKSF